jgi:uncharacterized membrane protein
MIMRHSLIKLSGNKTGILTNFPKHFLLSFALLLRKSAYRYGITLCNHEIPDHWFLIVAAIIILLLRSAGFSQGNAFSLVLDFTGAITGSIISFILPGAFYLKLYQRSDEFFYSCAVMFVFGIAIMITVPILSVLNIVG